MVKTVEWYGNFEYLPIPIFSYSHVAIPVQIFPFPKYKAVHCSFPPQVIPKGKWEKELLLLLILPLILRLSGRRLTGFWAVVNFRKKLLGTAFRSLEIVYELIYTTKLMGRLGLGTRWSLRTVWSADKVKFSVSWPVTLKTIAEFTNSGPNPAL